jgi:hypothetical protein
MLNSGGYRDNQLNNPRLNVSIDRHKSAQLAWPLPPTTDN